MKNASRGDRKSAERNFIISKIYFVILFFAIFIPVFFACKSQPKGAAPVPSVSIEFDRIEAERPGNIELHYRIRVKNNHSLPLNIDVKRLNALLDGTAITGDSDGIDFEGKINFSVEPHTVTEKPFAMNLNLKSLADQGATEKDHSVELTFNAAYSYSGTEPLLIEFGTTTAFPRIREPEFSIISIAVLQAELINTRFKVNLRIDNPNVFPLDLSAFIYRLYGDGRFWADGKKTDAMHIPAQDYSETELFLVMNFMGMQRGLLDDIIAMREVNYRFNGTVEIGTGVSWLPQFRVDFDQSGQAEVLQ